MILQTTTYEAQIPIPQSIVSLGILIMFALVQYRITRSNNITNEKGIKLKQLEALKVKQLSEPNENIMGNIRSITQEIIELDDEALRLRTLIDIPGGPSFRLRVANPTAVNAGSELKQQQLKLQDENDLGIDIMSSDNKTDENEVKSIQLSSFDDTTKNENDENNNKSSNKSSNKRVSLLDDTVNDTESMNLGEMVRTVIAGTTVLILFYVLVLLQNETMVNTTF